MDTKSLKKQLGAAIAMVLVAAVALGSSTYAWFVSNNTVKATTSNVSAKSNSAYLVIDTSTTSTTSTQAASATSPDNTALYPAIWANSFDQSGNKVSSGSTGVYQFESAYAASKEKNTEKDATRFVIGDADAANKAGYNTKNTFYVGTGTYDGIFENLKVTNFEVTNSNAVLASAMRVYVTDGTNWVVVKKATDDKTIVESQSLKGDSTETDPTNAGLLHADKFGKGQTTADVKVMCYVYYDGSDDAVYTNNLNDLTACNVTLTFEATPTEYGKSSTN